MALPVDPAKLLEEVIICKAKGECSPKLVGYLTAIAEHTAIKKGYAEYDQKEDMIAHTMAIIMRTWSSFNPAKSSNAYSFFYLCAWGGCVNYVNQEKRQRRLGEDYETYCQAFEMGVVNES